MMHLALVPRDGMFLKDGRGWYTSDVGRSYSHEWPLPSTVRGALRAAYGYHLIEGGVSLSPAGWDEQTSGVTLRYTVALRRPTGTQGFAADHRMWPVPRDAFFDQRGECHTFVLGPSRAESLDMTEGVAFDRLLHPRGMDSRKPGVRPLFWPEQTMRQWLLNPEDRADTGGLSPSRRVDLHVTIEPETETETPSMLFSGEITEPLDGARHEWALGVACELPDDTTSHPVNEYFGPALTLGGRRRLAWVESLAGSDVFAQPDWLDEIAGSKGLRLICVTPGKFQSGWLPDVFIEHDGRYVSAPGALGVASGLILHAALVPRPWDVSTWDMRAGRPRESWRLVEPGSVYFVEKQDGSVFSAAECRSLWLRTWADASDEASKNGFGLLVPGRWDPSGDDS
jgi:CRISPR-associated protein Cmr3